jgi:hypothetical protein
MLNESIPLHISPPLDLRTRCADNLSQVSRSKADDVCVIAVYILSAVNSRPFLLGSSVRILESAPSEKKAPAHALSIVLRSSRPSDRHQRQAELVENWRAEPSNNMVPYLSSMAGPELFFRTRTHASIQ